MSLNSARKLGLTASILTFITPIVAVIASIFTILSFVSMLQSWVSSGEIKVSFLSAGFLIYLVAPAIVIIVGFILFLLAMYQLSHYYNESGIFRNILYALVVSIVGVLVVSALFSSFLLSLIFSITPNTLATPFFTQFITTTLALVGVTFVFAIIYGVFYYRAFKLLAEKSGVGSFKSVGILYLLGTLLSVILAGGILIWIAWIIAVNGFHSLKPQSTNGYATESITQPAITQTIRCPFCSKENPSITIYCKSCGNKLRP
jgi:uncharacterized membrane protein